jgi:hypothetical protein
MKRTTDAKFFLIEGKLVLWLHHLIPFGLEIFAVLDVSKHMYTAQYSIVKSKGYCIFIQT